VDRDVVRIVLIGGTSHVGKSTVARALAASLGWRHLSTDGLARHPGRPWNTVPDHVRSHYTSLSVPELTSAQLRHYERMWPTIRATIDQEMATTAEGGTGLVLEGSGIWPDRVAELAAPGTAAFWLTAGSEVLGNRIRTESRFPELPDAAQLLVSRFIGRTVRYNEQMLAALERHGLTGIDVSHSPAVDELVDQLRRAAGR
jgi:2-phosphoglycerate kinase